MDFITFLERIKQSQCTRWSARQRRLDGYRRALRGKLYEHLKNGFGDERTHGFEGTRVLLDNRRAAVQENLANELVRDMVGMLFGESHRPTFTARKALAGSGSDAKTEPDQDTSDWIAAFIHDTGLWLQAIKMLWEASVGSTCVVLRVLGEEEDGAEGGHVEKGKGAFYFEMWPAHQCKPIFRRTAPSELESVERIWFVGKDALEAWDYDVSKLESDAKTSQGGGRRAPSNSAASRLRNVNDEYACRIVLDDVGETWYQPVPRYLYERADWKEEFWREDTDRSEEHGMDEVPARWVRPLPLDEDDLFPDGMCLFEPVIDFEFRIDRTLSQVGRAFDYAGDPQMARIFDAAKNGGGAFGTEFEQSNDVGGTASDMLEQSGGDVKFVEISADGLKVAIETYIKELKNSAREAGAMSRITPDANARTELSAVAMKMLNYAQTVLADILRITCVENEGLLPLIRLAMRMANKVKVALPSLTKDIKPNAAATISTSWPEYYELHGADKLADIQATTAAVEGGLISRPSGVEYTAGQFDIQDAGAELDRIEKDRESMQGDEQVTAQAEHARGLEMEKVKGENAVSVAKVRGNRPPGGNRNAA